MLHFFVMQLLFSKTVIAYMVLGFVLLLGAGYWYLAPNDTGEVFIATHGEFVQEVSASGKVQSGETVNLGFSQGGRVAKVPVLVGDVVAKGDLIVSVENGDARATLLQKEALLAARRAEFAELQAGTRTEELAVSEAEVANKEVAFSQSRQSLIEAVQEGYVAAQGTLQNQIDQFVLNPRSASPQILVSLDDGGLAQDFSKERAAIGTLFISWKPVTGMLSSPELLSAVATARTNLSELSDLLTLASSVLSRAVPTSTYPAATILEFTTDVATGRTNVQNALAGLTSAETAYRGAETSLTTVRSSLALKRAGSTATGLAAQLAQVQAAEADVAAAAALLEKTEIRAPFDGTITAVDAKQGQILAATERAVSMIGLGAFEIESYIPEINIALLSVGDTARITLDAYGAGEPFAARVVSIDPAETIRDGVSTYRVILAFETPDPRIRSGMTANVVITTDQRSGVMSVPQGLVRTRGAERVVNVLQNGAIVERRVETGAISSFGNLEIISGLQEGDVLPITD